jgi:hypothetical protein
MPKINPNEVLLDAMLSVPLTAGEDGLPDEASQAKLEQVAALADDPQRLAEIIEQVSARAQAPDEADSPRIAMRKTLARLKRQVGD